MNRNQIKRAAEKVLRILNVGGDLTYSELKKTSHLKDSILNAALGWLVAGGKVECESGTEKDEHIFAFHKFSFG